MTLGHKRDSRMVSDADGLNPKELRVCNSSIVALPFSRAHGCRRDSLVFLSAK